MNIHIVCTMKTYSYCVYMNIHIPCIRIHEHTYCVYNEHTYCYQNTYEHKYCVYIQTYILCVQNTMNIHIVCTMNIHIVMYIKHTYCVYKTIHIV